MRRMVFALFFIWLCLYGCGPYSKSAVRVGAPGTVAPPLPQAYRIACGDRIAVKMFYNADMNQNVTVQPDGTISLLLVHEIKASGLSTEELRKLLLKDYSKLLQQPELSVVVTQTAGNRIFVGGEVAKPAMELLTGPTTVLQAVQMAGGFLPTARTDEVVIVRRGANNNRPFEIALNAQKAMKGVDLSQDIYLEPYDLVIVPKSNIANVDLWVDQYINRTIGVIGGDFSLYYYATH